MLVNKGMREGQHTRWDTKVNAQDIFEKQGLQENLSRISLTFFGIIWAAESLSCPENLKIAYGST